MCGQSLIHCRTSNRPHINQNRPYRHAASNRTVVTDALSRSTTYAYDAANRVTSITQPDPDDGRSLSTPITTFAYSGYAATKLAHVGSVGDETHATFQEHPCRISLASKGRNERNGVRS
jgi:YD repeat-containing protein